MCNNEKLIQKIYQYCDSNIKRIDRMIDAGVSTDLDTGICYALGRIIDIIERGDRND